MRVPRTCGLPTAVEVIYIGKSADLRRRFREHKDIWREHNHNLRNRFEERDLEFWYAELSPRHLDEFESYLIREISPTDNERLKDRT